MKKNTVFVALFVFSATFLNAQLSLSFNAGANHHKTTVGYNVGNLVPYIGFEVLNGSVSEIYEEYESKGKALVFMPNIGVKAFLISKESIKGGLNIGLLKPFISVKLEEDGEEVEDLNELLDNFSSFGGDLSFFAEYFFADQFSVGGEFGYRFVNAKITNPDNSNEKIKLNLGGTYTSFSANFYF